MSSWPDTFDTFDGTYMESDDIEILRNVWADGSVKVEVATWNMHGKPGPSDLSSLLSIRKCHVYAIGTEECERSIAQSMIFTSKERWEAQLQSTLGSSYAKVASSTLQAIHLVVFVHQALMPIISDVQTGSVACGIGNTIGNKGGVGVSFNIGKTAMLFMNAHFAAHQNNVLQRNRDYNRIETFMPLVPAGYGMEAKLALSAGLLALEREESKAQVAPKAGVGDEVGSVDSDDSDNEGGETDNKPQNGPTMGASHVSDAMVLSEEVPPRASDRFDRVFFVGDFNYRVDGSRKAVEMWIREGNYQALIARDQLKIEHSAGRVFHGFEEAPLAFKPTYKFDKGTDVYDSSEKQRIPAWTDRILYKGGDSGGIMPLTYKSIEDLKTSDHRPVVGRFSVRLRTAARKPSALLTTSTDPSAKRTATITGDGTPGFGSAVTSPAVSVSSPSVMDDVKSPSVVVVSRNNGCFRTRRSNKIAPAPVTDATP